jgi:hypothetical protein
MKQFVTIYKAPDRDGSTTAVVEHETEAAGEALAEEVLITNTASEVLLYRFVKRAVLKKTVAFDGGEKSIKEIVARGLTD